jgi:mannan endo-1,4-beta-mannosidase
MSRAMTKGTTMTYRHLFLGTCAVAGALAGPTRAASADDLATKGKNAHAPTVTWTPGLRTSPVSGGTKIDGASYAQSDSFGNERFQTGYTAEVRASGAWGTSTRSARARAYVNTWAKAFGRSFAAFTVTTELQTDAAVPSARAVHSLYVGGIKVREREEPGGQIASEQVWLVASQRIASDKTSFTVGGFIPVTFTAETWGHQRLAMAGRLWGDRIDGRLTTTGKVWVNPRVTTDFPGATAEPTGSLELLDLDLPADVKVGWEFAADPSGPCASTLAQRLSPTLTVRPLRGTLGIATKLLSRSERTIAQWNGASRAWNVVDDARSAAFVGGTCPLVLPPDAGDGLAVAPSGCQALPLVRSFVAKDGSDLSLNGRRFRALGANVYYLQQLFAYGEQGNERAAEQARQALDQTVCMNIPVVRTWAFNDTTDSAGIRPSPGVYREQGLKGLDRAVAEAKLRGLRVILTVVNNHEHYGGLWKYAEWAGKTHDDFFRGDATMKGYWKDYVDLLANRVNTFTGVAYKDEPAILAWELANEFRCPSCKGNSTPFVDTVRELARHAKAALPKHLIADGGEGFDDVPSLYPGLSDTYVVRGDEGVSYSKLLQVDELDMLSYHLYPRHWRMNAGRDVQIWIDGHETLAKLAGKVPYLGEFGYDPEDAATRDATRAPVYEAWMSRLFEQNDGALGLLWQVIPASRLGNADDGFGVVYDVHGSTVPVVSAWARRIR